MIEFMTLGMNEYRFQHARHTARPFALSDIKEDAVGRFVNRSKVIKGIVEFSVV